ncbi:MAG: hypothetical protein ACJ0QX_06270 [Gammaproteobacteria bacterium]|tara:strand:- start:20563 stop:21258 length:696 start_codon:yes stop_codon:yes gene_type:complete
MRIILKSLLYTAYYIPVALKNYVPIFLYLVFSQFLVMYTQSIYLVLFFFTGYLIISSPLVINIFRNIILNNNIENIYIDFFKKDYTKIFLNRIFYLLFSILIIYIIHVIILSPFFPADIAKMTFYLYILFAYMIYIYSRIMFILPGAACGLKKSLKDSYIFTRGSSVKIFLLYILLIGPYVLINFLISNYTNLLSYQEIFIFISILMQLFFTIVSTSLVGYLYKDIEDKNK